MIVAVPRDMFVWNCVNLGKVDVYGVDVDVRAAWQVADDHRLSLAANYSFQRAMNMTDSESPHYKKQVAYLPQHTAGGSVSYENPWVNVTLHALGVSSRWANNEHYEGTRIDGYSEFGLCLWREFHWGDNVLTGRFDLKNLFDEQYEIVRNYPMPGRSYQLTINYKI
jgi:outer membrane receptor protein involved in Fe transport